MSRKKLDPSPFYPTKIAFIDSLDRYVQEMSVLRQQVETALTLDLVQEPAKSMLTQQLAALDKVCHGVEAAD